MACSRQPFLLVAATFVLSSLHTGQLASAEDSQRNSNNLQNTVEVPQDVLQNALYYLVGDLEYTPETRGMPIYHVDNLEEPKYIEIKLKPHGYLLASLTKEDFPIVRFNGERNVKNPTEELGEAHKYAISDESFDVMAIDMSGRVIKSLSNAKGGGKISDLRIASEQRDLMKKQLREEAKMRWIHDYAMECNRDHTIAVCSDKLSDDNEQVQFPDDFSTSYSLRAGGSVWDDDLKKFVELKRHGQRWIRGSSNSPWESSHISMVLEKRVGKCGFAKLNVPCRDRIYNKPLWIGDTRITIVSDNLDDVADERQLTLSAHQQLRGSWSSWSSWTTYSADSYTSVPNYNQHTCCGCISGCGAVAWAMLFAWADVKSGFSNTIYGTAAQTPPATMTDDVKKYIEAIRSQIGTVCLFGNGATYPWNMDDVRAWFVNRGGGDLQTSYNSLGIRTDSLRDCASNEIRVSKRPVVIGTGWLTHYPVATQYRVRSRTRSNWPFGTSTDYDREAYLNQGWGGSGNGWETLSTWFCGTIDP